MIGVERVVVDTAALRRLVGTLETDDAAVEWLAQALVADIGEHWSSGVSAPGEAPGVDTGTLANSITATRLQPRTWAVRDGVEYGIALEFGVITTNLAARPWMVPAVERIRERWPEAFRVSYREFE